MSSKKLKYNLEDLTSVVKKHLVLDDYRIVDVLAATLVANFLPTDPLWLMVVAAPSSAKTELLNSCEAIKETFYLSDLTKSTLISGKKGASLLPKLAGKIIIMKDFTTILSKRSDDLKIIMSQFREIYDGTLTKSFGTGDTVGWDGHVGFIGACTSAYDRHQSVIGQMGERFLLYRLRNEDDLKTGMQAINAFGKENGMRKELKGAFAKFFNQFKSGAFPKRLPGPDEDLTIRLISLAKLCSLGRCPVHRDRYSKEVTYMPDKEGVPRLVKQFYHLALALTVVRQESKVSQDTYGIVKKVGLDVIPRMRMLILRYLYEQRAIEAEMDYPESWQTTVEVARATSIHGKTTIRILEDLVLIGFLKSRRVDEDVTNSPWEWQIKQSVMESILGSEAFDDFS